MPLYEYLCEGCNHKFEEIVSYPKRDDEMPCPKCKGASERVVISSFSISTKSDVGATLVSPKEIDKKVGEDADKRWQYLEGRKNKRRAGRVPEPVEVPRGKDGALRPMAALGDDKTKAMRKEFSDALTEHRDDRKRKGLGQFDGPGAIET